MGDDVVSYFKELAVETGIPYQNPINLYLKDCVAQGRKLDLSWHKDKAAHQSAPIDNLQAVRFSASLSLHATATAFLQIAIELSVSRL